MQVLRAVVETGSVTAAAQTLGYTASAVSQQLAILERETRVPLLEKSGRGVRPTRAGKLVADQAGVIAKVLRETSLELAAIRDGDAGRLRIRWASSGGTALVPPAVVAYRSRNPAIRIEPCLSGDPLREVLDGDAELALLALPPSAPEPAGVCTLHLLDDPLHVVLPPGHRLASSPEIDLAQLADEQWVEIAAMAPVDAYQELIRGACGAVGFTPQVAVRADDFLTAQGFVAAGLGVRLASELALGVGGGTDVAVRPVRAPRPMLRICAVFRETPTVDMAVTKMLDELTRVARERKGDQDNAS